MDDEGTLIELHGEDPVLASTSDGNQQTGAGSSHWHWLAARGTGFSKRLVAPCGAALVKQEIMQALRMDGDKRHLCIRWKQDLVFDDCPPLLGFRSTADSNRALLEPKLGGLDLVHCGGGRGGTSHRAGGPADRSSEGCRTEGTSRAPGPEASGGAKRRQCQLGGHRARACGIGGRPRQAASRAAGAPPRRQGPAPASGPGP